MDVPCKIQGNIHILLCLIHKINVSRILGTYQMCSLFFINVLFHWEIIAIAYSFKYNKKDTLHFKVQELRLYNKRGL